jgi:hypothetical protein
MKLKVINSRTKNKKFKFTKTLILKNKNHFLKLEKFKKIFIYLSDNSKKLSPKLNLNSTKESKVIKNTQSSNPRIDLSLNGVNVNLDSYPGLLRTYALFSNLASEKNENLKIEAENQLALLTFKPESKIKQNTSLTQYDNFDILAEFFIKCLIKKGNKDKAVRILKEVETLFNTYYKLQGNKLYIKRQSSILDLANFNEFFVYCILEVSPWVHVKALGRRRNFFRGFAINKKRRVRSGIIRIIKAAKFRSIKPVNGITLNKHKMSHCLFSEIIDIMKGAGISRRILEKEVQQIQYKKRK